MIVSGADHAHFANARLLLASWWLHNRGEPLYFCDYGLLPAQREELASWPVKLLSPPDSFRHPWRAKAALTRYIESLEWAPLVWIDADAVFLQPLGDVKAMLEGYDLLIDAHRMAIGEIVRPETLDRLPPLDLRDAYFSSGFWITSSRPLLERWDQLCSGVEGTGNLWENDAFVAAVYGVKARVRTQCGAVWHVRGLTSLDTAEPDGDGVLCHAGMPCMVLHANNGYTVREDGRRVFLREPLRTIQDRYEALYWSLHADWNRARPS